MSVTFSVRGLKTELNVANGNASVIFSMLGLNVPNPHDGGEISPRTIISNLAALNPADFVRRTSDNQGIDISADGIKNVCRVVEFGLSAERISHYRETLWAMAEFAMGVDDVIYYS